MRKTVSFTAIFVSCLISTASLASNKSGPWNNSNNDVPPQQKMRVSTDPVAPTISAREKKKLALEQKKRDEETARKKAADDAQQKQEQPEVPASPLTVELPDGIFDSPVTPSLVKERKGDQELHLAQMQQEAEKIQREKLEAERTLQDYQALIQETNAELVRLTAQKDSDLKAREALARESQEMEEEKQAEMEALKALLSKNNMLVTSIRELELKLAQQTSASSSFDRSVTEAELAQVQEMAKADAVISPANSNAVDLPKDEVKAMAPPAGGNSNNDQSKPIVAVTASPPLTTKAPVVQTQSQTGQAGLELIQTALASSNPQSNKLGYLSMGYNFFNNQISKVWTSEKDRYAPGTYPSLTYASVLNTLKTKWFPKKEETDLVLLGRKDFHYTLFPIHFTSAQHSGGYFVPISMDCGRFTIETSDPAMRSMIVTAVDATVEQKNLAIYKAYVSSLKRAGVKEDMAAYNPIYDNQDASLNPYAFYLSMREFLEDGDNEAFHRDIQFCRRPVHSKHCYSMLTLRLIAFDAKKGYAVHWSLRGYRVDHQIDENAYVNFLSYLKQFENDDWLVKSGM